MRKVNNRKAIRNLASKSFAANRTRNVIAVLAIALTAMLFTTLFTVGIGLAENFQMQTLRQSGSKAHGVIKNITKEQYEKISRHPLVKASADNMLVADRIQNPEFIKRHLEMWYYPEDFYENDFVEIIDGRAPQTADEILMDEASLELLGKEPKAGSRVTLDMQIKEAEKKVIKREFTVSGVIRSGSGVNVGFAIVSRAYLDAREEELQYTYDTDYSATGAIRMDLMFDNSIRMEQKLEKVIRESGYSTDETDENYVASNINWAYLSGGGEADPMTIAAMAGAGVLILLTGYLIIYNIFQISVIRDIRFYGLLKTIGTTGKQIRRILRRQAVKLALMGIPPGLAAGFGIGAGIVPLMLERTNYEDEGAVVNLNPWIFAGAALFSLLTVFISTGKPARMAAGISPVEAVRYTEGGKAGKRQKKTTDGGRLGRMALSNLGRNKRKTAVVVASLSLALMLLNSIFTVTHAFDLDVYLKKFVSSDFQIANAVYFGMDHYWGINEESVSQESLSESFVQACEALDGFERGGRIYCTRGQVGLNIAAYDVPDTVEMDENGECFRWFGNLKIPFQKMDEANYAAAYYGVEDFVLEQMEVWEGETDVSVIREKLDTGKYVVAATSVNDNGTVDEAGIMHHAGDRIVLTFPGGEKREVEVLSVVKENYYGMTTRVSSEFAYYTTADTFLADFSDAYLMSYLFDVAEEKEDEAESEIEAYTTTVEPLMGYESKAYWLEQFEGVKELFLTVGGMLTLVVALIGILNFINSVLTGIVTRQRELAMLEAIGMTGKQIRRMLTLEGLDYAALTILVSLAAGSLLSVSVVRTLASALWFMRYRFVIWPMLLTFPVLLLVGGLVPGIAWHFLNNRSIIEQLREKD